MRIKRRKFLKVVASLPAIGYAWTSRSIAREEESKEEVEKFVEIIKLKYGKQLSEDQLKMIREDVEANLMRRERLLSYKLSNWDEPDFKFQV